MKKEIIIKVEVSTDIIRFTRRRRIEVALDKAILTIISAIKVLIDLIALDDEEMTIKIIIIDSRTPLMAPSSKSLSRLTLVKFYRQFL